MYVDALVHEIELQTPRAVDSIFFGGGTPSLLSEAQLERILSAVHKQHTVLSGAEISLECNPATADEKKLHAFRCMGINRLSIGVQSFSDDVLRLLGRAHNADQARACILDAQKSGFENINLDLMSGLPHQTAKDWENTLQTALAFSTKHISAYALIVEPGTPFEKLYADGNCLPEEETERLMYERTGEILDAHGFVHYEISNYAKPGWESRHNLKYWHCEPYLAAGLGAHGFDGAVRTENVRDLHVYMQMLSNHEMPLEKKTVLSKDELASEYVMMTLRLKEGLSLAAFLDKFDYDFYEKHKKKLDLYIRNDFMSYEDGCIAFTKKGIQVSNAILCELI